MQIISGTIFTILCLIIISSTTKKEGEGNITTKINSHLIEDEDGDYEKLENVKTGNGDVLTQEDLHAFPVTP